MATYPGGIPNFAEASPTNLGDPDSTGRTHSQRHDAVEDELEAALTELGANPSGASATVGDRVGLLEYGQVDVVWDGSAWICRNATITARNQINVAAYADGGWVLWDSSLYSAVVSAPTLAIAGDKWLPHGSVTP